MKHPKITPFILLIAAICVMAGCKKKDMSMKMNDPHNIKGVISYQRDFPDNNDTQLAAARAIGVKPFNKAEDATKIKQFKQIESNEHFTLDNLTHSVPYVVPQAAKLIDDIAVNFLDSLANKGLNPYRIIITSVTRSQEQQQQLSKSNINATVNSTHCYGTTFDISWKRFEQVADKDGRPMQEVGADTLKMVLSEVLRDARLAKRCYIKYERKQGCFHITARG
ncbi:MAG: hypothetical protein IJ628_07175 [Bacteroidaceae bacterium]|nr:hypothetical protein [Bacteroidaceae bacterium]